MALSRDGVRCQKKTLIIYIGAAGVVLKAIKDFHEKVSDFELKTIGTEKKVRRDKFFDFSIMKTAGGE